MPTIQLKIKDLESLLGRTCGRAELEATLPLVKGEIKELDESTGELKLELNDTNRPDLWCVEGVARQIKIHFLEKALSYPFLGSKRRPEARIEVSPLLKEIRPYIGACIARGLSISEESLMQLIQTQEKLSESFGRKRQLVSIGLYRLGAIAFPVFYKTVQPDAVRFVPLGSQASMTPAEIMKSHPKGRSYAGILTPAREVPLLTDRENKVLSFPPIINSREVGEVQVGDRDLFVEVTGNDLRMVMLTVNIPATNLADRGAEIGSVEILYPYDTDFGRKITMPAVVAQPLGITLDELNAALGETIPVAKVVSTLKAYGYSIRKNGRRLTVTVPAYRDDLLHPVDVVEDYAISRGYESFVSEMPTEYTLGGLSPLEMFSDRVRESMIGMGFQEVISNILTNREESIDRMNLKSTEEDRALISVDNVMSQTYSALRIGIIPSLLGVEAASSKSFYPHRIFEAGETAAVDPDSAEGTRTRLKLAVLIAHPTANFSELHSSLDLLMFYMGSSYQLEPTSHLSFIEGRAGKILVAGHAAGLIGELHPRVLENWQIAMPGVVFEVDLEQLRSASPDQAAS
jgi:phenylalanyl-tRNA synthetase beta chain